MLNNFIVQTRLAWDSSVFWLQADTSCTEALPAASPVAVPAEIPVIVRNLKFVPLAPVCAKTIDQLQLTSSPQVLSLGLNGEVRRTYFQKVHFHRGSRFTELIELSNGAWNSPVEIIHISMGLSLLR